MFAVDALKRACLSSSLRLYRRSEALEGRYRAAAGVGEEAHSRQPHWCPWSKPMNVETCANVADLIVMAHAFAELRDGVMAHGTPARSTLSNIWRTYLKMFEMSE